MKQTAFLTTLSLVGVSFAQANEITLSIEIPSMEVAEYHRPYVAAWIENDQKQHHQNLIVWYQSEVRKGGNSDQTAKGETWLKDLRKWWRISGRELTMPIDGVSSATKPPGTHQISLSKVFQNLPQGNYNLIVEASREVGGREVIVLPFTWDGTTLKAESAQGKTELGSITLK